MVANPYEFLAAAKQSRSIAKYIREFETRAAQIKGITNELCLGLFLNGLREDIGVQTFSKEAIYIFKTMDLAREVEHKLLVEKGGQSLGGGHNDRQRQVVYDMRQLSKPYAPKVDHGPSR